jgi:hypothetical protein
MFGKKFKQERVEAAINFAKAGKLELTEDDVRDLLKLSKRKKAPEKSTQEAQSPEAITREHVLGKWQQTRATLNDLDTNYGDMDSDIKEPLKLKTLEVFMIYFEAYLKQ